MRPSGAITVLRPCLAGSDCHTSDLEQLGQIGTASQCSDLAIGASSSVSHPDMKSKAVFEQCLGERASALRGLIYPLMRECELLWWSLASSSCWWAA